MISELMSIASALAGNAVSEDVRQAVAEDVAEVARTEDPLFSGPDARERTGILIMRWAFFESAWRTDAMGDCNDNAKRTIDTCRSFGPMQTNRLWYANVPAILKDRRLAFRVGLGVMRHLTKTCGSVTSGLLAYASGTCKGNARARAIVARRCKGAC